MSQTDVTLDIEKEKTADPANFKQKISFWDTDKGQALNDIIQGLKGFRLWWHMACSDVRRRYRRTVLGPFWTTLSLTIFLVFTSILFSRLWKIEIKSYLPYFSAGFIGWTFIASMITEGSNMFVISEGLVKQMTIPYSNFAWHVVARNFLVLLHHMVVYAFIVCLFAVPLSIDTFVLIIPALILICLTGVWVSLLTGLLCARFRDIQQVINSVLQIALLATPILWPVSQLVENPRAMFFVDFNILYHYINIFRMPLLGQYPPAISWIAVSAFTLSGWILTFFVYARKRRLLVFWL